MKMKWNTARCKVKNDLIENPSPLIKRFCALLQLKGPMMLFCGKGVCQAI